jgi:hypothetical protein
LQDWLVHELSVQVFRDVDAIPPGVAFDEHLREALSSCELMLVVIEPTWDVERLSRSDDFVRMELEHALERRVPLASLLIAGARLPDAESLPSSLRPLLEYPAYRLRTGADFARDIQPIGHYVRSHLPQGTRRKPRVLLAAGALLLVGAAASAGWIARERSGSVVTHNPSTPVLRVSEAPEVPQVSAHLQTLPVARAPSPAPPEATAPGEPLSERAGGARAPERPGTAHAKKPAARAPQAPSAPAADPADPRCKPLQACTSEGRCTAVATADGDYDCIATSQADCESAVGCKRNGLCSLDATVQRCVAASDADCAGSMFCHLSGDCQAIGRECKAADDAACRGSQGCTTSGRCTLGSNGVCVVASDADCARTEGCTQAGRCGERNGACAALNDAGCRASADCSKAGKCTLVRDSCASGSDADCATSSNCKEHGACALDGSGGCKVAPSSAEATAKAELPTASAKPDAEPKADSEPLPGAPSEAEPAAKAKTKAKVKRKR